MILRCRILVVSALEADSPTSGADVGNGRVCAWVVCVQVRPLHGAVRPDARRAPRRRAGQCPSMSGVDAGGLGGRRRI
eukprot:179652-Rhodomonas_salina.2